MSRSESVIVEIRAAEGGDDARALVRDQLALYVALGARRGLDVQVVAERVGAVTFRATGPNAVRVFRNESGGHRWQRVPPSEKRGRVQTSTVTVAVLREPEAAEVVIDEADLQWSTCRAGKSGGQHMQKTDSAVQVRHLPTGITVRCESERSQHQNRASALAVLRSRLVALATTARLDARNGDRRGQIGSGQRGDKRRTIREADGTVTDHVLDVRIQLRAYKRGDWGALIDGDAADG